MAETTIVPQVNVWAGGRIAVVEPEPIPPSLLVAGYEQACQRFYAVMRSEDRAETFPPLFEALSWAVSIDDRFQSLWAAARTNPAKWWSDGFAHGDTARGIRYARNRVHHQWADALWLSHSGFSFPVSFPLAFIEWRWRPELPPGRGEEFKAEYEQHIAASPARVTLGDLSACFADALPVLAP